MYKHNIDYKKWQGVRRIECLKNILFQKKLFQWEFLESKVITKLKLILFIIGMESF